MPEPLLIAAIAGMATATYATRVLGYWLLRRRRIAGRLAAALDAVPGAVLVALVAPAVLATGPRESLAAAVTVALALRTPMPVAMAGGCAALVLLRWALP